MKFLVTGSTGLVGTQIVKDLDKNNIVYSCYNQSIPTSGIPTRLDLLNQSNIEKTISDTKPDVIIHLAAMTNVDQCEKELELAAKINSVATETLAKQAKIQNAFLIYVSTDYVFDGEKGMKKETDIPNPLGVYGRTKLEGENKVQNLTSKWAIARISTPFGNHATKKSFPIWIKENLENKKQINVLIDQFTSPTYVPNLSKMLIEIATRQITGIIHVSGASRISRYDFAELVADKLFLDKKLLVPTSISQMNWIAKRPKDSSLDVSKANQILDEKPQKINESLELFIKNL